MGKPGKKASNIFQKPGIKNNNGVVLPKIEGIGSPLKNGKKVNKGEIKEISGSELMKSVPGYNPRTGYVMQGASGNLGLIGGILGGAAKTFSRLTGIGRKKSFWPQTKNTGDLYAKARARKSTESIIPKGKGYTTDKIQYQPGPVHGGRSQDLGLHRVKPNRPNINFARKTDVIGKGELYGNVRAFNKPGMKKTHFGPKKQTNK